MKKITRKNVFETNSSSTHAISIPKKIEYILPKEIHFNYGEFGWQHDTVDPQDYLYTAFPSFGEKGKYYFRKMKDWLESDGIVVHAAYPSDKKGCFWPEGYIDHCDELHDFIKDIMNDKDKLYRYLFAGKVVTGNDQDDYDLEAEIDWYNPDYDCYYKGN